MEEDSPAAAVELSAAILGAGAEGREFALEESVLAASTFAASVATFTVADSLIFTASDWGKLKTRSAAARNIGTPQWPQAPSSTPPATSPVCCPKGQVALAHRSHF